MIEISDITFNALDADRYGNDDLYIDVTTTDMHFALDEMFDGGDFEGGLALRFLVDGQRNQIRVCDSQAPIPAIAYAIEVLTEALEQLKQVPDQVPGRCLALNDWGRCQLPDIHIGLDDHQFPPAPADFPEAHR